MPGGLPGVEPRKGEREGGKVKMRVTAANNETEEVEEPMFYVAPEVPLPPKTDEG